MKRLIVLLTLTICSLGFSADSKDMFVHGFGSYVASDVISKTFKTSNTDTVLITVGLGLGWEILRGATDKTYIFDLTDVTCDIFGALGWLEVNKGECKW